MCLRQPVDPTAKGESLKIVRGEGGVRPNSRTLAITRELNYRGHAGFFWSRLKLSM